MFHRLAELYGNNIDRLDAYVGGMLESTGHGPGELFSKVSVGIYRSCQDHNLNIHPSQVIFDQFIRLRDADRFWFENKQNGFFTDEEVAMLRKITLRDIIRQTTEIQHEDLQQEVISWGETLAS